MVKAALPVSLALAACAIALISFDCGTHVINKPTSSAGPQGAILPSFVRGPYLSTVTRNSIVVSWSTSTVSSSTVEYGTTEHYGKTAADQHLSTLHSLTLTGLAANTRYHYRAVSGGDTTGDYSFFTAAGPEDPFVFIVYGDTRTDHAAHQEVLKRMAPYNPRFIINTGDLVASNTPDNWNNYFDDICEVAHLGQTTPFFSVVGNHENGEMYYDNLFLPRDNPADTEAYYSFDYGSLHCIALDSEIPYAGGSDQYIWLLNDVAGHSAKTAKFKIAFWHKAPYSSSRHGSDRDLRKVLCPIMESNGVDIVFNGHDHTYERTRAVNGTTYVVSGGGGAPLYKFTSDNEWTAYKESVHHFCEVSIDQNVLTMRMVRSTDGAVRDSLRIVKPADSSSKQ